MGLTERMGDLRFGHRCADRAGRIAGEPVHGSLTRAPLFRAKDVSVVSEPWDAEAFRRRMGISAERNESYRNEHRERLRRGQSNGSKAMHDHALGEWWASYRLATSAATERPDELRQELVKMRQTEQRFTGAFDQEDAQIGYEERIDILLRELDQRDS